MRQATELTRKQKLIEATRAIKRALSGQGHTTPPDARPAGKSRFRELESSFAELPAAFEPRHDAGKTRPGSPHAPAESASATRPKRPLGEVMTLLRHGKLPSFDPDSAPFLKPRRETVVPVPDGSAYLARSFACEAGSRNYKIYVPSHADGRKRPLLIMLHGCTQNPDDFAIGTGMNKLAEEHGFIVAYPEQSMSANHSACWNWFKFSDQLRDAGEPAIIAGITRSIIADFEIDASRIYVAGLSAGGAMAAVMSATYPELYAATGIHSGLAYGSATDMASAFAAMRGTPAPVVPGKGKRHLKNVDSRVRTIVFHGAADHTVHPSNAEVILAEARAGLTGPVRETQQDGFAGGRAYTCTVIADARGVPHVEYWAIKGFGHAWSGGSPDGSYTDSHGPDASREMLRFFLERPARRF
jgi:poly(hydroxyalkanoate) depolymerase family esterase